MNKHLATFERTLTANDSKQNIPFKVQIPAGITGLNIQLTFSPATVDGIRNLLTLTVFDPSGWRGSGHRHGMHDIVVGAQHTSPGFLAGATQPGEWTVVVDTHMVMPGPPCMIHLEVNGTDAQENRHPHASRLPEHTDCPAPRGRGWYRGDLHAHSIHSDASWDVPDLIAWSRTHKLDFCTLSDHNTVSGLAQMDAACTDDLLTMGGMELTTFWGHALALGLRDWIDWHVRPGERTIEQIASEVEARGGLFIIAHPLEIGDPYCTGCQWHYEDMLPGAARVVEVWNTDWASESNNEAALQLVYNWLNQGHRLALISGTDNHGREPDTKHYGFDVVYAEELSEREILCAVRAGHLYISSGPQLALTASAGEQQAMMGDVLNIPPGEPIHLAATWHNSVPDAKLDLIVDGQSQSSSTVASDGSRQWELEGGKAHWCLLTLREPEGRMLALTNPIYFDGRA